MQNVGCFRWLKRWLDIVWGVHGQLESRSGGVGDQGIITFRELSKIVIELFSTCVLLCLQGTPKERKKQYENIT